MTICPFHPEAGPCDHQAECGKRRLCVRVDVRPFDLMMEGARSATHFVGFRDTTQYDWAVRVFGPPDFVHHVWDQRAQREVLRGYDRVVFAKYHDCEPSPYNYDDSNQADDPAAAERMR